MSRTGIESGMGMGPEVVENSDARFHSEVARLGDGLNGVEARGRPLPDARRNWEIYRDISTELN